MIISFYSLTIHGASKSQFGNIDKFECSVFDGQYVTADIDQIYLQKLEENRSDTKKKAKNQFFTVSIVTVGKRALLAASLQDDI